MHDDAGRVEDPREAHRRGRRGLVLDPGDEIPGREAGAELLARAIERAAGRVEHRRPAVAFDRRSQALVGEQPVDRGKVAERVGRRRLAHCD